jgi:photosystem II stability/assembly factor-like uncharacterized protein
MLVGLAGLAGLAGLLCLPACSTSAQLQPPPPRPDGDDLREERKEGVAHPHGASFRWNQRRSANGTVPVNAIARMKEQRDQLLAAQPELPNPLLSNWRWLGPGNIGGRIRAIAIHPTKPNTMWIGSVAGGIWKTTNGGASWFPLDDFAPVMSVSDLDIDPKNPDKIYASTGEAGFFDSVSGSSILAAVRGAGIFVTTNGGTTWSQLASTKGTDFQLVNRLAISPTDNKVLLAATPKGIFHSTDAGASWSKRSTVATMDIDFHPTDGKQAIAGSRDGMPRYSTDAGITWKNATGITTRQRVEVAYAPGNPTTVYAAVSQSDRIHVYRSTNGGQSYTARYTGTLIQTYSRYNNVIWVDPADTNTLLVGGVRLYRSINGGSSWQNAYSGSYYDYHVVVSHPGYNGTTNQTVFHGNDGGIYRTTAFKAATLRWQELNNNLGITQSLPTPPTRATSTARSTGSASTGAPTAATASGRSPTATPSATRAPTSSPTSFSTPTTPTGCTSPAPACGGPTTSRPRRPRPGRRSRRPSARARATVGMELATPMPTSARIPTATSPRSRRPRATRTWSGWDTTTVTST